MKIPLVKQLQDLRMRLELAEKKTTEANETVGYVKARIKEIEVEIQLTSRRRRA